MSKGLLSKDARNNAALLVIDAQNVRICTATTIVIEYPIGQTQYSIYKDTNELALGFGNRVFSIHHLLKFDQLPDGIVTQQTVDDLGSTTGQNLTDVDQLLVTKAQRLAV